LNKNHGYYTLNFDNFDTFDDKLKNEVNELKMWDFLRKQIKEVSYLLRPIVILTKVDLIDLDLLSSDTNPKHNASKFLGVEVGSIYLMSSYNNEEIRQPRIPEKDFDARNILLRLFAEGKNKRKRNINVKQIDLIYHYKDDQHEVKVDFNPKDLLQNYFKKKNFYY